MTFTRQAGDRRGITRLELLVVVAMLGLLTFLLFLGLVRDRPKAQALQCLANLQRVTAAVTMYARDNSELFPPNPDDGTTNAGYNWCGGDVQGGMPPGAPGVADMTNPDLLKDPSTCLVTRYLVGGVEAFRCPADPRYGPYLGTDPAQRGKLIPAARSISMNHGVGTIDPSWASGHGHAGKPTLKVNGPWLDGRRGHKADSPYATFGKMSDFGPASPTQIFLLADENPASINDASLSVCAAEARIIDLPGASHNHGGSFSFCDGHAEVHPWKSGLMDLTTGAWTTRSADAPGTLTYEDWYWLASHATINLTNGAVP